jgi:hypothetical protein
LCPVQSKTDDGKSLVAGNRELLGNSLHPHSTLAVVSCTDAPFPENSFGCVNSAVLFSLISKIICLTFLLNHSGGNSFALFISLFFIIPFYLLTLNVFVNSPFINVSLLEPFVSCRYISLILWMRKLKYKKIKTPS